MRFFSKRTLIYCKSNLSFTQNQLNKFIKNAVLIKIAQKKL